MHMDLHRRPIRYCLQIRFCRKDKYHKCFCLFFIENVYNLMLVLRFPFQLKSYDGDKEATLTALVCFTQTQPFQQCLSDTTRYILNLSDYDLSDTESFVLSRGLNLGLPPRYLRKKKSSPNLSHCGHSFTS